MSEQVNTDRVARQDGVTRRVFAAALIGAAAMVVSGCTDSSGETVDSVETVDQDTIASASTPSVATPTVADVELDADDPALGRLWLDVQSRYPAAAEIDALVELGRTVQAQSPASMARALDVVRATPAAGSAIDAIVAAMPGVQVEPVVIGSWLIPDLLAGLAGAVAAAAPTG